ncbi:sigma-70 family RNA polymerase sigma factor, partial [Aquicoccus sp. SCR17]|nr:sigma-70 family RNA polymerase sigma factor [Carideicomes alvinocaridis]
MATLEEIEGLIARVALGDRSSFAELYTLTSAKLFGICLRVLDNRSEAEDALQEIFVKIWRNADKYRANGLSPMTWLITVARNHAIDRLRARRAAGQDRGARDLAAAEEVADAAPGPEASAVA